MVLRIMSGIVCLFLLFSCQDQASKASSGQAQPVQAGDSGATGSSASLAAAAPAAPDTTALQGDWYLQATLPSDTAAGRVPMIHFDLKKSRFSGNTGCNNMNGQFWFSVTDSSLTFSDKFAVTRMACSGYNENAFVKSLLATAHYVLKNGKLVLLGDDNRELSHWGRKPASALTPLKA